MRAESSINDVDNAVKVITAKLMRRLEQHGKHFFASRHEALGVVEEEIHELLEATRSGDLTDLSEEFMDVAVGALWGYISCRSGKMDW